MGGPGRSLAWGVRSFPGGSVERENIINPITSSTFFTSTTVSKYLRGEARPSTSAAPRLGDVGPLPLGEARTSLQIPPLLALTYAVLGGALPAAAERVVGTRRLSTMAEYAPPARAAVAVASTVAIIKLSETLQLSALAPSSSLALLAIACTIRIWIGFA